MIIGIYKIVSPSGKIYIGQSVNIDRTKKYRYKNVEGCIQQPRIYRSLKKYGFEAHDFDIIQEYPINELNQWETHWKIYYLSQVHGDWNKVLFCDLHDKSGGSRSKEVCKRMSEARRGVKLSEEHKLALRKPKSEEGKINMSLAKKGKPNLKLRNRVYSDETKQKMRLSKKDQSVSQETKDKISESKTGHICYSDPKRGEKISLANKGRKMPQSYMDSKMKSIIQYDLDMNIVREWNSAKQIKDELGIDGGQICNACKGKFKTAAGFIWKYKESKISNIYN